MNFRKFLVIDCFKSNDPKYSFINHNKLTTLQILGESLHIKYSYLVIFLLFTESLHDGISNTQKANCDETHISHVYNGMIKAVKNKISSGTKLTIQLF